MACSESACVSVTVQDVRRWFFTLGSQASGPHSRRDYASICFAAISAAGTHAPIKYITLVLAYQRGRCGADKDLNTVLSAAAESVGQQKGALPHVDGGGEKSHIWKSCRETFTSLISHRRCGGDGIFHGAQLETWSKQRAGQMNSFKSKRKKTPAK